MFFQSSGLSDLQPERCLAPFLSRVYHPYGMSRKLTGVLGLCGAIRPANRNALRTFPVRFPSPLVLLGPSIRACHLLSTGIPGWDAHSAHYHSSGCGIRLSTSRRGVHEGYRGFLAVVPLLPSGLVRVLSILLRHGPSQASGLNAFPLLGDG